MNTKDGKKPTRIINREYQDTEGNIHTEYLDPQGNIRTKYQDSEGNIHTEYQDPQGNIHNEYKDLKGNIHTEYREPQTNTHSYKNGYVDGNIAEQQSEDRRESRTDKNISKGLLIGVIVTCVAGLTAGTIYFLTKDNNPEIAPVVIMPISKTNPKPTQPTPQVQVVEKPVVTIVKVPVPQTDQSTVNITTNPSPSNPPSKPASITTTKPAPVAVTPVTKPAPVAVTPVTKPTPVAETQSSSFISSVASPTLTKTDNELKAEILKQFEDNLPNNQLMVEVKNGDVTVSGTTATPEQLQQIQPLLKSIEGINKIDLKATVASPMQ